MARSNEQTERERAIRYSRTKEWLVLVGMIWSAAASVLALTTGLSSSVRDWASAVAPKRLGPVMPYVLITALASYVISLPLSYFGGYVVEHRYRLSNQSLRAWFVDGLKGLGVSIALGLPLAQGVYWVIRRYPNRWWAILSGALVPFSVLLSNLAPVLLMPLFNKFEPLRNRSLAKRITDLAAGEGVHVSDVLQMDMSKQTKKANAMFTGIGNTKRIILGDTLLDEFTDDEVEVVLAHELGHQVHRDLWKLIALQVPLTLATFFAAHKLTRPIVNRFGKRWGLHVEEGAADVAALPLLSLIGGGAGVVLGPVLNAIVRNFVEHPADAYALDLTRKRQPFIGAMEKLAKMNLSNPRPAAFVKWMLYDHPPIGERIEFAQKYDLKAR
ncbi:MAG TPA: M48 family metallopeptidase [Chloroflexota bacterium]